MNQWQKDYLAEHSPSLIADIKCNISLLTNLRKHGVLGDADVSTLSAVGESNGEMQKTYNLLEILKTRVKGYEHLTKSLYDTKQTGALLTLLSGVQNNVTDQSPFVVCDIDVSTDQLHTKIMDFEGTQLPLEKICKLINIDRLQQLIKTNLCASSYENFISDGVSTFVRKTVPEPLPYYMPRSVFMNNKIDARIFKNLERDIILVEDIELHQLTQLVRRNNPSSVGIVVQKSSSQIHRPTAKIILLEHPDHFSQISEKTEADCHWLKQKSGGLHYVRSNNGKGTQKIKKYLTPTDDACLSQDVFIEQIINDSSNSPVILYDSPGMGKSVLLAEIGRSIKALDPHRNVIFLQLTQLVRQFEKYGKEYSSEAFKEILLDIISTTNFSRSVLKELFEQTNYKLEIFLDGYDEVYENDMGKVKKLLAEVIKENKNMRFFITTRLHRSNDLEEIFGSLGHKILPFSEDNQIDFFLKYWKTEHGIITTQDVGNFAKCVLAVFPSAENPITGIPLQCRMLAEIFSADARRGKVNCVESELRIDSVYKMYKAYMDTKIKFGVTERERQFCYDYHTKLAFEILFAETLPIPQPDSGVDSSKYYEIGILEPCHTNKKTPNFVHQTFAEFIAAEYMATKIKEADSPDEQTYLFTLDLFFGRIMSLGSEAFGRIFRPWLEHSTFQHLMVIHFFNISLLYHTARPCSYFKKAVQSSKYFDPEFLLQLLEAALACNAQQVFIFLLDVFLDADKNSSETYASQIDKNTPQTVVPFIMKLKELENAENLVHIASQYSSPDLVELSYNFLVHWCGVQFNEKSLMHPLGIALKRGSYQMVEYLLSISNIKLRRKHVAYCIEMSNEDEPAVIKEKIQILKLIFNKEKHMIYKIDLSSFKYAHIDLLKFMIDVGADVTKTKSCEENICHLKAQYLSPDEYHQFVVMMLEKGHGSLFTAKTVHAEHLFRRDEFYPTAIHSALKRTEVKSETLIMLSKHCKINFNDKSIMYHESVPAYARRSRMRVRVPKDKPIIYASVLAYAIIGGRSVRVLKDLISLGADWKNRDNFDGGTALSLSVMYNNIKAFEFFLSLGANPYEKTSFFSFSTPLALQLNRNGFTDESNEFVRTLTKYGFDLTKLLGDNFTYQSSDDSPDLCK